MGIKTDTRKFFAYAKKKWQELNSEEAKLKRMSARATKEEDRYEREEKLAHIQAERYRLKRQVEEARSSYLRAKASRESISKRTGGDNLLGKLEKMIMGTGSKKKQQPKHKVKTASKPKKDPWNFWD